MMKHLLKAIQVVSFVLCLLFVFSAPTHAGIYGCVWNPTNALGEQCMLDGTKNACAAGEAPNICDLSNEVDCNKFNGNCVPVTGQTTWACGADGKCVLQNNGIYPTEVSCTQFCKPKVMWNCVDPLAPVKCQQVFTQSGDATSVNECNAKCLPPPPNGNGTVICTDGASIYTAIGCIPFDSVRRVAGFFISWGIGIGGGWALLLIIYAGVMIITSSGDPSKLQAGKELLISAISGVIMLIFSVFILRLIGVNVLGFF